MTEHRLYNPAALNQKGGAMARGYRQVLAVGFVMLMASFFVHPVLADEMADKPNSDSPKILYERLGGESAIKAVVDDFVQRAAADPAVNFTRQGTERVWEATPENMEKLKTYLVQFISVSTGATSVIYEGRDLKTAHQGMKITNAEFDALAADLKASLDQLDVPEQEQKELLDIVGSTRAMMVEEQAAPAPADLPAPPPTSGY